MSHLIPTRRRPATARQTVLITGAASGIGAATARTAVGEGHHVIIADIDLDAAKSLAAELSPNAMAVELDVRDPEAWSRAFDAAETAFRPVTVLINNAGIIHTGRARTLTSQQHRDIVEVNLLGPINGIRTGLDRLGQNGPGHIITVCSMTAFLPLSGYATYAGTKHGLRAFHHSVAIEERGRPITFSSIHPPATRTPMLAQEMADPTMAIAFAENWPANRPSASTSSTSSAAAPSWTRFPPTGGRGTPSCSRPAWTFITKPASGVR